MAAFEDYLSQGMMGVKMKIGHAVKVVTMADAANLPVAPHHMMKA